jgi:curli biogenesis system outer membrane secretion channel CsgG
MLKLLILPTVLLFSGCMSNKVNLADYKQHIKIKETIPQICKSNYKKEKTKVAVVNFTNNSTFGAASLTKKASDARVGIIGMSIGAKSDSSTTIRTVEPKLAKAFIPLIEKMLLNTGGTQLYTRSDLDKVDAELKLQDSGLLDPNSVVEFGLTSGVKYIITGSIDYVDYKFKDYSQYTGKLSNAVKNSDDDNVKMAAAAINFATSFFDGTSIKTAITVKILDVATGKVVFSQQIKKDTKINSKKEPTYDQLVGAVKNCISEALPVLQTQFQEQFSLKGYITKLRKNGDDIIAQINLGREDEVKVGQVFLVQSLEESEDPLTNKKSCDLLNTNIKLTVTKHISKNTSWLKVEDTNANIKLLQLVRRIR